MDKMIQPLCHLLPTIYNGNSTLLSRWNMFCWGVWEVCMSRGGRGLHSTCRKKSSQRNTTVFCCLERNYDANDKFFTTISTIIKVLYITTGWCWNCWLIVFILSTSWLLVASVSGLPAYVEHFHFPFVWKYRIDKCDKQKNV